MRAIDAMIVWTPHREPFDTQPTAGAIEVTTIPEPTAFKQHPMSVGACDLNWRETDDAGRVQLMQRYFTEMIHRDEMNVEVVKAALSQIDEFAHVQFSTAPPADDDE